MKIAAIATLLVIGTGSVSGHPPSTRALGGNVVVRKFATGSNTFVDTTVAIDVNGDKTLQSLKPLSHPRAVQMISTTSDASYVTCDYTCGHRGAVDGKTAICGSTTMKFGAASNILDASWVDSVDEATCFVSATDPTVVHFDDGQ
ncbi:uncharacterized protein PV07_07284 [Cladophialophora immunda]|uniref:Pectate lyase n=1 Tax=Cladophialophora immunda TaxID=569365 RepID=A0A0D1ZHY1_9EURO|nr:uncharacterized protein PV07_07284 [Cladophialophora immunda]KIW27556.1 hypothetical protein PV07_07284 [Cladophialophora immunda]OQU97419.1 hypothetical protein CLAIMM_03351 [Cladophialophora immunda]